MTDDDFRLHHAGEIREALIMIEGDSGGFELVKHGLTLTADREMEMPYALVRSTDSGRTYFLVREPPNGEHCWPQWQELSDAKMAQHGALA